MVIIKENNKSLQHMLASLCLILIRSGQYILQLNRLLYLVAFPAHYFTRNRYYIQFKSNELKHFLYIL